MTINDVSWSPGVTLSMIEQETILAAFRHFRGNKTQTSISLGISIRTLENKLESYKRKDTDVELEHSKAVKAEQERRELFIRRSRGRGDDPEPRIGNEPDADFVDPKSAADFVEIESRLAAEKAAAISRESDAAIPKESGLSVPERAEVQELPSRTLASSGARKPR